MAEQLDISLVERQRRAIEFCVRSVKSGSETLQLIHQAIQSRSRPMRFLGFSNHEKGDPRQETRLFHYPPETCGKRSAARFREVGGAL
jgi:hypothetical protein